MGMMFDKKKDKMTEEEESKNLLDANGTAGGILKTAGGASKLIKIGIIVVIAIIVINAIRKKRSKK